MDLYDLKRWAREEGLRKLKADDRSVRWMQEVPDRFDELLDQTFRWLVKKLHDPREFDGSQAARDDAVVALEMAWEADPFVKPVISDELTSWYLALLGNALSRTPNGTHLEIRPEELDRIRNRPYDEVAATGRHGIRIERKKQFKDRIIQDVRGWTKGSRPSKDPTTRVWFFLEGHRTWTYYVDGSEDTFDWVVENTAREVARSAQFAAELFPAMLKLGGFGVGFSARFTAILAGEILEALGDQGLAEARGQRGKSGWEMLQGGALGVLIGHFGGRLLGSKTSKLSAEAEAVIEKSVREARLELVKAESGGVASAIKAGHAKEIKDAGLRADGYRTEVDIVSDGGSATWRKRADDHWCRIQRAVCVTSLGDDVAAAAAARNIIVDLAQAGVSKVAANKVGGRLVLNDLIARIPAAPRMTPLIRVEKNKLPWKRGGDENALHLGSKYGLDDYIRYHVKAPGLGKEGFPITLAPLWMNHGASRIETFMRTLLEKGWEVQFKTVRSTFSGEELRPYLRKMFEEQETKALSRIANDGGILERYLKSIDYEIYAYRAGRLQKFKASMLTDIPPTGAMITDAFITKM